MTTSDLSTAIDNSIQDFMDYVSENYKAHDTTTVTAADLHEYSNRVVDVLSDMQKSIIAYLNQ